MGLTQFLERCASAAVVKCSGKPAYCALWWSCIGRGLLVSCGITFTCWASFQVLLGSPTITTRCRSLGSQKLNGEPTSADTYPTSDPIPPASVATSSRHFLTSIMSIKCGHLSLPGKLCLLSLPLHWQWLSGLAERDHFHCHCSPRNEQRHYLILVLSPQVSVKFLDKSF